MWMPLPGNLESLRTHQIVRYGACTTRACGVTSPGRHESVNFGTPERESAR